MSPATRASPRVALVTCARFPRLWEDDHLLLEALVARDVAAEPVVWDDPAADWSAYDLVVIRSPWDYVARRDEFVAWARRVPRLCNPADVIAWNTDKRYLAELTAAGLPVTPTTFVAPGETWTAPAAGEWVVKPAISAGSQDTGRYLLPDHREPATAHVARLTAAGRVVMVQPYLQAVDTVGETALIFFPDRTGTMVFSHAIRKGAMLTGSGDEKIQPGDEKISARKPSDSELAVALRVLAHAPKGLLYARVDVIPGPDWQPLLVELELTEPSLFLGHAPGAPTRLAEAIIARL